MEKKVVYVDEAELQALHKQARQLAIIRRSALALLLVVAGLIGMLTGEFPWWGIAIEGLILAYYGSISGSLRIVDGLVKRLDSLPYLDSLISTDTSGEESALNSGDPL